MSGLKICAKRSTAYPNIIEYDLRVVLNVVLNKVLYDVSEECHLRQSKQIHQLVHTRALQHVQNTLQHLLQQTSVRFNINRYLSFLKF